MSLKKLFLAIINMAENKKSFILYADYQKLFEELTDIQAGQLIKHILAYVNDEGPIAKNNVVKVSFILIEQQLKRDLKKWEGKKGQQSDAGINSAFKRFKSRIEKDLEKVDIEFEIDYCKNKMADGKNSKYFKLCLGFLRKLQRKATGVKSDATNPTVNDNDTVNVTDILEKEKKELFYEWLEYRRLIKKPINNILTIKGLVKKFNERTITEIKQALELSIVDGQYAGLFWKKEKSSGQKGKKINRQDEETIRQNAEGWVSPE